MKTTVICIGDSITEGIGSSDPGRFSYVSELALMLGEEYTVINRGRNGATLMPPPNGNVDDYMRLPHFRQAREDARAAKERGDRLIVSLMLGTNDADVIDYGFEGRGKEYYDRYHDRFVGFYFALLSGLLEEAPDLRLIVSLSPYSYDNSKHESFGNLDSVWKFQREFAVTAAAEGVRTVINDMAAATAPEKLGESGVAAYFGDRLHPNDLGHMYFAHEFYKAVKAAEAL